MNTTLDLSNYIRRTVALPSDHGSWVFILSPLSIGLFAGQHWSLASSLLVAAAMLAFLLRQPVTIAVKALSGRRPLEELPIARFWIFIYGTICLAAVAGLLILGFGYILLLAIPALPVFAWHLVLVGKRAERRQMGIELVGSGTLALAAPAAFWVGLGYPEPRGWLLFALVWLQSAASIVYAYLRLEQRKLPAWPDMPARFRMGRRALLYTSFNLAAVITGASLGFLSAYLPAAFALQWLEAIWGALRPAVKVKPTSIGIRQLVVSVLFTILFILTWT